MHAPPPLHVSAPLQAFPSAHDVPLGAAGVLHVPVAVSQLPATWHASAGAQTIGLAPVHVPHWHVSSWVHAFPSEHAVPSARAGCEHVPVAGLHAPAAWHASLAAHAIGLAPVHTPA